MAGRTGKRAPSDEEIICTWMETRPKYVSQGQPGWIEDDQWNAHHRWWKWFVDKDWQHLPIDLDLDALWEVEELLSCMQNVAYRKTPPMQALSEWGKMHANAPTRIKALAAILRPEVGRNS